MYKRQLIPDTRGYSNIIRRINVALQYPSSSNNLYIINQLTDESNYGQSLGSVWDKQENLNPWLAGGVA